MKGLSAIAVLGIAAIMATGCATMKDKSTTANVKSRVIAEQVNNLSHVKVETKNGVVHLRGTVDSVEEKKRIEQAAQTKGHRVVSHLQVKPASTASASPRMDDRIAAAPTQTSARMQTLTGEVTSIDHSSGKLSVKTEQGTMDLSFPPSAVQNVKQGDRLTVSLGAQPGSTTTK